MKKLLLAGAAILALAACNKNDTKQQTQPAVTNAPGSAKPAYPYLIWWDHYCVGSNGNCIDGVVVHGRRREQMTDLAVIVDGGKKDEIMNAFNSQKEIIAEYIPGDLIAGVIDGTFTVDHHQSSDGKITWFSFYKDGEAVNHVNITVADD